MAQDFYSPFFPFGAYQPEDELLYPEQGMQFGVAGNSLFGTQPTDSGVDPTVLAGLGLGGGIVAAGTGGQAATSQVLSPFAQKIAAQDAARLAAQNRPILIGQPTTTQGVLVPETRLTQQTQLANPKQLPAVRATGGAPAPTGQIVPSGGSAKPPIKMAEKVGQAGLPGTAGSGSAGKLRFPGASTISKLLSTGASFIFPESLGDSTISGAYDRLMEAGDVERAEALGYTDPSTEMFNAAYQEMLARKNMPQLSRLGDEPLTFTAPTGPSSTAAQAAQLAGTLPDDSGLMGAPSIQGTGIPTTTLNIDGGSVTVPQALADQTFRGISTAPMGVEETRARLGGRTLNEYLNAPSGTEGVSGLRTDPQGRMVPAGFETLADAYGDYEGESDAREARLAARMQQPGETITERDTRLAGERTTGPRTYGGYTTAQVRDVYGGGDALRAAQVRAEMQGKQAEAEYLQEQQTLAQQANYKRQQKILESELKQAAQAAKPSAVQKAIDEVNELISVGNITQDQAKAAVLQRLKYDPEKLLSFNDIVKKDTGFTEDQEARISKVMKANPQSSREQVINKMKEQGKL